jgi:hypothetical protein
MATKTANLAQLSNTFDVNSSGAVSVGGSTGTSGQVLTSQGSGAAIQWADPSTGLTLLATLTPTNGTSSVSVTGLASRQSLMIVPDGVVVSSNAGLAAYISSNNGSSYSTQNIGFTNGNSTTPAGFAQIFRTDASSSNKPYFSVAPSASNAGAVTDVTGVINAIKVDVSIGGPTYTGAGKIYVYGLN